MTHAPQPSDGSAPLPQGGARPHLVAVDGGGAEGTKPLAAQQFAQLFPNAPAGANGAPIGFNGTITLWRIQLYGLVKRQRIFCDIGLLVVVIVIANTITANALVVLALLVIVPLAALKLRPKKQIDQFYSAYGAQRGLTWMDIPPIDKDVYPVSMKPYETAHLHTLVTEQSKLPARVLSGRVGPCPDAAVLQLGIGDGREFVQTSMVTMALPERLAASFSGVMCRPLHAHFDTRTRLLAPHSYKRYAFESEAFNTLYEVRIAHDQDMTALYELFTPDFIERMVGGYDLAWWQSGTSLVVPAFRCTFDPTVLDELCLRASVIYDQYVCRV